MMTDRSTQIVKSIYEDFGRGDLDALSGKLHPEVVVRMHGPASIPYGGGERHGRTAALEWFVAIASTFTFEEMTPEAFIASGEMVAVQGHEKGRSMRTGHGYSSGFVHIWKLHDGLVLRMDDYVDSAAVGDALRS